MLKKKPWIMLIGLGGLLIVAIIVWIRGGYFDPTNIVETKKAENKWFLCKFGPDFKVVAPVFYPNKKCDGSAKVQVYQWYCGEVPEVNIKTREFLENINIMAEEKCKIHCAQRADGCQGIYKKQAECGYSLEPSHSIQMGKKVGCHTECDGRAFMYCSLYHAGITNVDENLIKDDPPNCYCTNESVD